MELSVNYYTNHLDVFINKLENEGIALKSVHFKPFYTEILRETGAVSNPLTFTLTSDRQLFIRSQKSDCKMSMHCQIE